MLEAINLSKRYGPVVALDQLNLKVNPGEMYCLLGANGAGKTTTINIFLGFVDPDGGEARVNGNLVSDDAGSARHRLAYIPEQVNLYPHLTGVENLDYFSALAGFQYEEPELQNFLIQSGLESADQNRSVAHYSKGMRQKVGVAIALAKCAEALLLDEPTAGLDPKAGKEFSLLLHRLKDQGVAVLMATHDLFRAKEDGSRVGIMRRGKLVDELDAARLRNANLEKIYLEHMGVEA